MSTTATKPKVSRPRKKLDESDLKIEERSLRDQYPRIVRGTLRNATARPGPHIHKRTVEIKCEASGCQEVRRIATSDLHQVTMCDACTVEARLERRRDARRRAAIARKAK